MYIPNFNFLAQFGRELGEEQHFLRSKMRGRNLISPLLIDLRDWFLDMLYSFKVSINWLKKGQFLRFWPISTSSPKLGHNWIWTSESWKPQNTHLGLLLNIHNKFQLPTSIWKEVMRGKISRNEWNEKIRQKITFLELKGVEMELKSRDRPKGTSRAPTKCIYLIFNFLAQFGGS